MVAIFVAGWPTHCETHSAISNQETATSEKIVNILLKSSYSMITICLFGLSLHDDLTKYSKFMLDSTKN